MLLRSDCKVLRSSKHICNQIHDVDINQAKSGMTRTTRAGPSSLITSCTPDIAKSSTVPKCDYSIVTENEEQDSEITQSEYYPTLSPLQVKQEDNAKNV